LVRLVSSTIVIGALAGAVIGGLGGRLVMRILFLTTGDEVKGLESDDGFTIGQFTLSDTIGLVIVTAFLGIVAALLLLAARPFVVRFGALATPAMAVFYGIVGGALLVKPDGVDFTVLEPVLLAIALFVLIFALFGAVVSHFVISAAADDSWAQRRSWWLLGPPLLALALPPMLVVAVVAAVLQLGDTASRWWRVTRAGALATMGSIFVLAVVNLVDDAMALTQ